jgi:hypothetical protein
MKTLIFDEFNKEEINRIQIYLSSKLQPSNIDGLYWLILPTELLNEIQTMLFDSAGPYRIAVELKNDSVRFELLIRADEISNKGGCHANGHQAAYIYDFASTMAEDLGLKTCL